VLLAVPPFSVATPAAYTWWDEQNPSPSARGPVALDAEAFATWGSIGRLGGNDFEQPVFGRHPELRTLYERIAGTGPVWVRMSGSGSAIAAVYKKESERDEAAQRLGSKHQRVIATSTRSAETAGLQPL
jgi:4-diphosphocytidyl-2-C-methyl-D-erythritol kinase